MSLFAGIDLGTSGIKIALVDEAGTCLASAARACPVDRPHPGWSQQDPRLWWQSVSEIFDELAQDQAPLMARLAGISLSGQMLGPVLLDRDNTPVTPCILWNDQRALAECDVLLERVPDIGWRTNGAPDPGLGAPKLLWLAQHRPDALGRADMLLLPKDYVRLCLTGDRASDVSDASGTMLMDCATGAWDPHLVTAAGWDMAKLPPLLASYQAAGDLRADLCRRWKTPRRVVVAAGCGDNYAGALGVGASIAGRAALSIGTSGVLSAVDDVFHPAPDRAILTTPHAAPATFLSMGVVMSATQSLDWLSALSATPPADLAQLAADRIAGGGIAGRPVARASITGVRTPDNRPDTGAVFAAIPAVADKADLAYAVMEGVAFQFYDCYLAQRAAQVPIERIFAVGGGTRSPLWLSLIATLLKTPLAVPQDGHISACLGAAKLAQAACAPDQRDAILARRLPEQAIAEPVPEWTDILRARHATFRKLPFL